MCLRGEQVILISEVFISIIINNKKIYNNDAYCIFQNNQH